jgi:hypothetical protein
LNSHRFSPRIDPGWQQNKFFPPALLEMGSDIFPFSLIDHTHRRQYVFSAPRFGMAAKNQRSRLSLVRILEETKENTCSQLSTKINIRPGST